MRRIRYLAAAAAATMVLSSSCGDDPVEPPPTNQPPRVSIAAPATMSTVLEGTGLQFRGTATDPEDGTLSGSALKWSSDIDGSLGNGASLSATLTVATHWIVLEATDSKGKRARDSVTVLVQAVKEPDRPLTETDVAAGFVAGRILVGYRDNPIPNDLVASINRQYGVKSQTKIPEFDAYVAFVEADKDSMAGLVRALRKDNRITFASLDALAETPSIPIDYDPDQLSHLYLTGADLLWKRLVATGASLGGSSKIAIIDTGIDTDHPEFSGEKIVDPASIPLNPFETETGLSLVEDADGHGTHVASITAGSGAEGNGLVGVAPDATIIPIKVGKHPALIQIARAVWYALDHGADIINISMGSPPSTLGDLVDFAALAIPYTRAALSGVQVVVSAGNCGHDYSDINPFARTVIAVGGANVPGDDVFSNIATSSCPSGYAMSQGGPRLDIVAPAVDIRAAGIGGGAATKTGTSQAAPIVAGLIALYRSAGVPRSDIEEVLKAHSIDLGDPGQDDRTGWGRVIAGIGLDSVRPSTLVAGVPTTVALWGRNFDRGATVLVGSSEITPQNARVDKLTFDISTPASAGSLPVFVRHPHSDLVSDTLWIFTGSPVFGSFTDGRDGKTYKTVTIADRPWFAENLDYLPNSYQGTYGRLYSWQSARAACPQGWHLPNDAEWNELIGQLGGADSAGMRMKEAGTEHWDPILDAPNVADNSSGFTALPGGYIYQQSPSDNWGVGHLARFWSATGTGELDASSFGMNTGPSITTLRTSPYWGARGFSVRCIQD